MRNISLIVRRELSSYLRTPSGYIIAAGFLLVNGLLFNLIAVGRTAQLSTEILQTYLWNAAGATAVAAALFSMRFLADERQSGTQTLLLTSPIREEEIVLGKFAAAVVFLSILILLSVYIPALIFIHGKVSWGHIGAGYLGLILLGSAVLAIGMFASSLVPQPFLAVILTGVFAVVLHFLYQAAEVTEGPMGELLTGMSLAVRHFIPFRRGLVQLSDLVYYASLIYFFLFAATRVLKSQRWQ